MIEESLGNTTLLKLPKTAFFATDGACFSGIEML
jgi:hypothetical protein